MHDPAVGRTVSGDLDLLSGYEQGYLRQAEHTPGSARWLWYHHQADRSQLGQGGQVKLNVLYMRD